MWKTNHQILESNISLMSSALQNDHRGNVRTVAAVIFLDLSSMNWVVVLAASKHATFELHSMQWKRARKTTHESENCMMKN
jgi:hypothetical protein